MAETRLTSLSVTGFRNYASCQLDIAASNVLLLGPNGAGKTNLLEAISMLARAGDCAGRAASICHMRRRHAVMGGRILHQHR